MLSSYGTCCFRRLSMRLWCFVVCVILMATQIRSNHDYQYAIKLESGIIVIIELSNMEALSRFIILLT